MRVRVWGGWLRVSEGGGEGEDRARVRVEVLL